MKETKSEFEFFVFYIFPMIIIGIGLTGNTIEFVLLTARKNLSQLGPVNMYRFLFLTDNIALLISFVAVLVNNNWLRFSYMIDLACKVYKYTGYVVCSYSSLILFYILLERFLAVAFPVESNLLRSKKRQLVYFMAVTVINTVYYILTLVYYNIQTKVELCETDDDSRQAIQVLLILSKILIPVLLIVSLALLLVYTIVKSKSRMTTFYTQREHEIFKKDVDLSLMAIAIITFSIVFMRLNFILFSPLIQCFVKSF